jgi:hypothetical protein
VVGELEVRLKNVKSVLRKRAEHDGELIDVLKADAADLRQRLESLQGEADARTAAHDADIARFTEYYNGVLAKHASATARLEKSLQQALQREQTRVLDVSVAKAGHESVLLRMRKEIDDLRSQHASSMEAAARAHETKLADVILGVQRAQHAYAMEAAHAHEALARVKAVEMESTREITRLKTETTARHEFATARHEKSLQSELKQAYENAERKFDAARAEHASQMQASTLAHAQALSDAKATLEAARIETSVVETKLSEVIDCAAMEAASREAERTQHAQAIKGLEEAAHVQAAEHATQMQEAAMEATSRDAAAKADMQRMQDEHAMEAATLEPPEARKRKRRVIYNCK